MDDDRWIAQVHVADDGVASERRVPGKPIVVEVVPLMSGNRLSHKLPFVAELGEVGLEGVTVSTVGGIVVVVVFDLHNQHHHGRLDARPQPLEQQEFLIGAVGGDAGVDDPRVR